MVATKGTLHDRDVNDVVVIGADRQRPYSAGLCLGEIFDVAALEQKRQVRLRSASPTLCEHARYYLWAQVGGR